MKYFHKNKLNLYIIVIHIENNNKFEKFENIKTERKVTIDLEYIHFSRKGNQIVNWTRNFFRICSY